MIVDAHIISTYSQYVCISVVTYLKTREKIEVRKKRKKNKKTKLQQRKKSHEEPIWRTKTKEMRE